MSEPSDRDREMAVAALYTDGIGYDLPLAVCNKLGPAIAQALSDARREENEACEAIAQDETNVLGVSHCCARTIADAIAARRQE